jgi:hypothetical protein
MVRSILVNNNAAFSIKQKDSQILYLISEYIQNIPLLPSFENLVKPGLPHCIIRKSKNENAYLLTISNTDVLFQYIYPFFKNLNFMSRKSFDFKN